MLNIFSTSIPNISTISCSRSFRLVSFYVLSFLILFSCEFWSTSSSDVSNSGDSDIVISTIITFAAEDNKVLDEDILVTLTPTQTDYVFYVPKTADKATSLILTGRGELTGITATLDFANTQSFTHLGTTYTIRAVRKPTVADGPMIDTVSLDYNIISSDTVYGAVFALYESSVTGITADHVKNIPVKLIRNLESGTTEHLVVKSAGTTASGASTDPQNVLKPNTSYNLYMVYDFANGTQLIDLGAQATAEAIEVTFTVADNPVLDADISFTVSPTQTDYVFYVPKTVAEAPSLNLKGSGDLTGITAALDFANAQSFTHKGTTYTIRAVRKPTVTDAPIADVVSLDYYITSDTLNGAVFALYEKSVTGITADHVKDIPVKMTRNLESGITEHLLVGLAGTTAAGASKDTTNILKPNTSYNLYMVYDFANGTQLIDLSDRTTVAATVENIGGELTDDGRNNSYRNLINTVNTKGKGSKPSIPASGENSLIGLYIARNSSQSPESASRQNYGGDFPGTYGNGIGIYASDYNGSIRSQTYYGNTYELPGLANYHVVFLLRVSESTVDFFGNTANESTVLHFSLNFVFSYHTISRD